MPFCPQCGVDNPAAARYCDQCGAMLIPVNTPAPIPIAPSIASAPSSGATLMSSVTSCPQCGQQAIPGEAFCDNCGAALNAPMRPVVPISSVPGSGIASSPSYPAPQSISPPVQSVSPPVQPVSPPVQRLTAPTVVPPINPPAQFSTPVAAPVSSVPPVYSAPPSIRSTLAPSKLMVAASGAIIVLPSAAQAIVGRADAVSQFFPDIDLTPHGALEQGVGRRHMRLFVSGAHVMIEDLESTNGTLINGQRLSAHQAQQLRNGDQITVGKLVLQYQE